MHVLIYEDAYYENENVGFLNRLSIKLPKITQHVAGSFKLFETHVLRQEMDVFILDIMGADTDIKNFINQQRINSQYLGIEILHRIRNGYYYLQNSSAPIIMRTARADELRIIRICDEYSVIGVFLPGRDDNKVIDELIKISRGLY